MHTQYMPCMFLNSILSYYLFFIEPSEIESFTHSGFVLVKFIEDEYLSIVPISNITDTNVKKGDNCQVKWSDKKLYSGKILALG